MKPNFYHLKFQSLRSTQSFLTSYPNIEKQFILISSTEQTSGKGRRDNIWVSYPHALSFSFNLPMQSKKPLTLHLGNAIIAFAKEKGMDLKLKWPNDLYTRQNLKCGGILTERRKNMDFIGIGLNIKHSEHQLKNDDKPSAGFISYPTTPEGYQHTIPLEILNYIIDYSSLNFSAQNWENNCVHHNKLVLWNDHHTSYQGVNTGIDNKGGIKIKGDDGERTFYTGSLRIL